MKIFFQLIVSIPYQNFFGYFVVEKLKFVSFDYEQEKGWESKKTIKDVSINKYKNRIKDVKNEKIKKSLIELTKVFKEK